MKMANKLTKIMSAVCAIALLASCGQTTTASSTPASSTAPSSGSTSTSTPAVEENPYQITEEPTTFTIFMSLNNMAFDSEWPVYQKAGEMTNVYLEGVIPMTNSDLEAAWNLMISSGDLADILTYNVSSEVDNLYYDGGIMPLTDYINETDTPNIVAAFDELPIYKADSTALDGEIYKLGKINYNQTQEFWWIRQDWLDKLGLEAPTTVDEMYTVLTAFRTQDPNGNGEMDEVPYFDRAGWKMADEILWLWNSSVEFNTTDDGKVIFDPMEEDFVTAVGNAVKWYEEGLIDPEIFTRGTKSRDVLFGADQGGLTHDWPSAGDYNNSVADQVPGFNLVPIAPPANQHGDVIERTAAPISGQGWAMSSLVEDPETLIKYFDFWYTKAGEDLMNFGVEGLTYTVAADGSYEFTDLVMQDEGTPLSALRNVGVNFPSAGRSNPEYEEGWMTPIALEARTMYLDNQDWYREEQLPYNDGRIQLKYTQDEADEYNKIMANIRPYVDETWQSWLLGTAEFNDSTYAAFQAELEARDIARATEINQAAYERYLGI